jgi:hypothetical protein
MFRNLTTILDFGVWTLDIIQINILYQIDRVLGDNIEKSKLLL